MAEVCIVVADIDAFSFRWERTGEMLSSTVNFNQEVGQFSQADNRYTSQIKDMTVGVIARSCQQESVNSIVNVGEVPHLLAFPNIERFTFENQAYPKS